MKYTTQGNQAGSLYVPAGTYVDILYEEDGCAMCQTEDGSVG